MNFIIDNIHASFTNNVLIADGKNYGEFKRLKEAREFVKSLAISLELQDELYHSPPAISRSDIAIALTESGEYRVTNTLVELFKQLIENKVFFPSNTLLHLREQYNDSMFPDKIEYRLQDGSSILIDKESVRTLNSFEGLDESIRIHTRNKATFVEFALKILGQ